MRAVVTGGAGGIGTALRTRLGADGYDVIALDVGAAPEVTACDVTDRDAVFALADELGPVELLVNNAAIWPFGRMEEVKPEDFARTLAVNVVGPFNLIQAFGTLMLRRGSGAIVNVASIGGIHPTPYTGAYSASKAALIALTKQVAYEWGPHGIRVNAVAPGVIQTDGAGMYTDDAVIAGRAAAVPLRRLGRGDDIADVVAFLASDSARYVNGQVLLVDGGLSTALMGSLPRPAGIPGGGGF